MKATRLQEAGRPQGRDYAQSYKLPEKNESPDRSPWRFAKRREAVPVEFFPDRFWLLCRVIGTLPWEGSKMSQKRSGSLGRARKRQKRAGIGSLGDARVTAGPVENAQKLSGRGSKKFRNGRGAA